MASSHDLCELVVNWLSHNLQASITTCDILRFINRFDNSYMRRGDLVETVAPELRYRNDGTFIFDGKNIVFLDYEIIDNDGTPSLSMIHEFGENHWDRVLSYKWKKNKNREAAAITPTYYKMYNN